MRKTRLNFVILLLAFFAFLGSTQAQTARIQLIHNAADAVASSVDVFVNGAAFYPNFDFRTATPFVDVPAGTDLTIDIAPAGAGIEASVYDITVNFDADETYVIVANGIVSDNGYDPAPAFSVYPFAGAREAGMNTNETDLLVFHGATDAPEVSVWAMGGDAQLFSFAYGEFAGYLGLPTNDYVIEVRTVDGETTVVAYSAPLATLELEGAALTVVASGFLNPANNSDGPAFGLFVATAAGGNLIELPVYEAPTTVVDIIVGSEIHTTLAAAVTAAGLVETLQGEGPFTVFAPTDAAFAALPEGLLDQLLADPTGALTDILLYHVVAAYALSTDLTDGQNIQTIFGENINVTINNNGVFINNEQVIIADLVAGNGVVHVIDAVLVPTTLNTETVENSFGAFNLFPNPASNDLNLAFELNGSENVMIEIFNMVGSRVLASDLGLRTAMVDERIDISFLPRGSYILSVKTPSQVISRKINVVK